MLRSVNEILGYSIKAKEEEVGNFSEFWKRDTVVEIHSHPHYSEIAFNDGASSQILPVTHPPDVDTIAD